MILFWALGTIIVLAGGIGWLRYICHRENRVDWGRPWINCLDGLNRIMCRRFHRLQADPVPLPEQGGAVLVANHVSGLDPLLMAAASSRPLRFVIATEQYDRPGLTGLFRSMGCIPVDRQGRPERALRVALQCLRDGEVVVLFPHGKIHLDTDPPRRLKGGAVRLAQLSGTPIIPLRISGVSGEGQVVAALLKRSHARLTAFPPIDAREREMAEVLDELAGILDGRT